FFQAEDGIRDRNVTGVQTCALPIYDAGHRADSGPHPGSRAARRVPQGGALRGHAHAVRAGRPAGRRRGNQPRRSHPLRLPDRELIMAKFAYLATDPAGAPVRGTQRAQSREDAELALFERELRNIQVTEKRSVLKAELTA